MVDKDYIKIAKARATRPKNVESYRKIMIYGRNKKGKSRFGLSAGVENTLVLDPEQGTLTMKELNPYIWPINRWEDLQEAYGALRTGEISPRVLGLGDSDVPFSWVSVDGLTRMNSMALTYVRKLQEEKDLDARPGMIDRRDYGRSGEMMKQMLLNFHTLKMNVIYTAQERMITANGDDEDDETAYFVADLPASARGAATAIVEVIGRIYTTRAEVKTTGGGTKEVMQRRLWIGLHERYDTGFRSDFKLPDLIKNPTLDKLTNLMLTGTEK